MKKRKQQSVPEEGIADMVLGKLDKVIPGFGGFFKKASQSKAFGARIGEIRKEIGRRFGSAKK